MPAPQGSLEAADANAQVNEQGHGVTVTPAQAALMQSLSGSRASSRTSSRVPSRSQSPQSQSQSQSQTRAAATDTTKLNTTHAHTTYLSTADTGSPIDATMAGSPAGTGTQAQPGNFVASLGLEAVGRHSLGIFFLLVTVVLWTASNFLASYVFADNTYAKPYFVTYINTSTFAITLPFTFTRLAQRGGYSELRQFIREQVDEFKSGRGRSSHGPGKDRLGDEDEASGRRLLDEHEHDHEEWHHEAPQAQKTTSTEDKLSVPQTAWLSLEFCLLWFLANYFVAACLEYTTVSSASILTATSSIWTLIFGAIFRIEGFTLRKLLGVLASTAGVILISMLDMSGQTDENRGSFPHKTAAELTIGNSMAILSAVFYGVYSVLIKKRIGNEDRIDMPLFFGLVGLFNVVLLWPGFVVLHFTGLETFELPPTGKIWAIVVINSVSSLVADYTWAWAMLLTTPLIVTVGLSLTIPLSIVGQMLFSSQYSSPLYWLGALIVVGSFLFIERESHDEVDERPQSLA